MAYLLLCVTDLGWDNWVIYPNSLPMVQCKLCTTERNIIQCPSPHADAQNGQVQRNIYFKKIYINSSDYNIVRKCNSGKFLSTSKGVRDNVFLWVGAKNKDLSVLWKWISCQEILLPATANINVPFHECQDTPRVGQAVRCGLEPNISVQHKQITGCFN